MESLLAFARSIGSVSECEQMRANFPHKCPIFRFLAVIWNLCSHLLAAQFPTTCAHFRGFLSAVRIRAGAAAALPLFCQNRFHLPVTISRRKHGSISFWRRVGATRRVAPTGNRRGMTAHHRGARPCAPTPRRMAGATPALPGNLLAFPCGEKGGCPAHPHPPWTGRNGGYFNSPPSWNTPQVPVPLASAAHVYYNVGCDGQETEEWNVRMHVPCG